MSEAQEVSTPDVVESNVEVSSDPVSTEIGSGEVEKEVLSESNLKEPIDAKAIDEVSEEIQDAVDNGASNEEIKEIIETFKFKANGKEKEVTLDWNNKEDIIKRLQMAEAAPVAMQKAAELEKAYGNEIARLKANPWEVLEELGLNADDLAEDRIQQQIDQLQKSPEQLAQEAQTQELAELREKLKAQAEEKKSIEFQQLQQQAEVDLDHEITEALSSTTELPKTPYVMKRVADALMTAMDNGYEDVKVQDILPIVEKEINDELRVFLESMPDKVLEQYMGNKITDRLRKQRLSKNPKNLSSVRDTGKTGTLENAKDAKVQTLKDFLKHGIK